MALVTTTTTGVPQISNWDIPNQAIHHASAIPRAEIQFLGSEDIPAVGVGDTALWQLNMSLPANFAYRLVRGTIHVETDITDITDWSLGMRFAITDDTGVHQSSFINPFWDQVLPAGNGGYITQGDIAGGNDIGAEFVPTNVPLGHLFEGATTGVVRWFNANGNSGASQPSFLFTWLQYDVAQLRNWQIRTPSPVISP